MHNLPPAAFTQEQVRMAQVKLPLKPGYLRIVNWKKPDEWLILHRNDYDPARHTLWSDEAAGEPLPLGPSAASTEEVTAVPPRVRRRRSGNDIRAYTPVIKGD